MSFIFSLRFLLQCFVFIKTFWEGYVNDRTLVFFFRVFKDYHFYFSLSSCKCSKNRSWVNGSYSGQRGPLFFSFCKKRNVKSTSIYNIFTDLLHEYLKDGHLCSYSVDPDKDLYGQRITSPVVEYLLKSFLIKKTQFYSLEFKHQGKKRLNNVLK